MRYRLRVAPRAEEQIREAAGWWVAHRPKAPLAFEEDLEEAFELVTSLPGAGQQVRHSRLASLRRLLMGRVRYYLYYQTDEASQWVDVLALWHASRGISSHLKSADQSHSTR